MNNQICLVIATGETSSASRIYNLCFKAHPAISIFPNLASMFLNMCIDKLRIQGQFNLNDTNLQQEEDF